MSQTTAQRTAADFCNSTVRIRSITLSKGSTHSLGPVCAACGANEARCAFVGGCCDGCSHFDPPAPHGTERAYQVHRRTAGPACPPCREAHARHNLERKS